MASLNPSLSAGAWIATQRRQKGITQERLAEESCLSLRQIQRLEQGRQPFSTAIVDAVAVGLALDPAYRQHLENLAMRRRTPPPPAGDSVTRVMIEQLDPHLAAAVDWNWNVLAANTAYFQAFPGLKEWGNVLLWFLFDRRSQHVMVEWREEASLTIRWWKHSLVLYGENEQSQEIFQRCWGNALFREVWGDPRIEAERSREVMLIRDQDSVSHLRARLYALPVSDGTLYYLGVRT